MEIACSDLYFIANFYFMKHLMNLRKEVKNYLTKETKLTRAFTKTYLQWVLVFFIGMMGLSASAQCTLACNGTPEGPLQVSVNQSCSVTLVTDNFLEAPQECPGDKLLTIRDSWSNFIAEGTNSVTFDASPYIGQILSGTTLDIETGTVCVSFFELMDFIAPEFEAGSCEPVIINCVSDTSAAVTGYPTIVDNCDSEVTLTYVDNSVLNSCLVDMVRTMERVWTATDASGNSTSCTQLIKMERANLDDVIFPSDTTLSCDNANADFSITGMPMLYGEDIMIGDPCNFATSVSADTAALCGEIEYQIIRNWLVIDNCTNFVREHQQVILVLDQQGPDITCPDAMTIGAVTGECYGATTLPTPVMTDNCSSNLSFEVSTSWGAEGVGPHSNIPQGTHTITYTATDECGNESTCTTTLTVVDDQIPVAVCNDELVVSIPSGGLASVPASAFDEGSTDNCNTTVYFKVKRVVPGACGGANGDDSDIDGNQEWYDDQVIFCCEEMEEDSIMVAFRVYEVDPGDGPVDPARELPGGDLFDHFNDCQTRVTVQDQIPPTFTYCPEPLTIDVHDGYEDLSVYGTAHAVDNCSLTMDSTIVIDIDECGIGSITRSWTATDLVGHTASCTQVITVVNNHPLLESHITWPENFTTYECGISVEPEDLPLASQGPVYEADDYRNVYINHTDALYTISGNSCYKILRKWNVIDWCNFDVEHPENGGSYSKTQIIKVLDSDAPVLTCPQDIYTGVTLACSGTEVTMEPATATDGCSSNIQISNNSPYAYSGGADASGIYPKGETQITFTATDGCGNSTTCQMLITIVDDKAPTPLCIVGLSVDLVPMNGEMMAVVPVSAFDGGATDNCTPEEDLKKTIRLGDGGGIPATDFEITVTCADVGNQLIEYWVTDAAGNADRCVTYLAVQDNNQACDASASSTAMIAGTITTEMGENVEAVMVIENEEEMESQTGDDGHFAFEDVQTGVDYSLTPNLNTNIKNGVSTMDLILITKHILGNQLLDSPYKIIAADVDKSGGISTFDLIKLRKIILGIDTTMPNGNTSWRFVPSDYVFTNPSNPFADDFPSSLSINDLNDNETDADFIAIKVGDVNLTAVPNSLVGSDDRMLAYGNFDLIVKDRWVEEGETVTIDFLARDMDKVAGYQFTLNFDPEALEFMDVSSADLTSINENNFGTQSTEKGILTSSWNQTDETIDNKEMVLFSLTFYSMANANLSDLLMLSSRVVEAEAYTQDGDILGLELTFLEGSDDEQGAATNELFQNRPNPFSDETIIPFQIEKDGTVILTVFDLTGRIIYSTSGDYASGYNEILVGKSDLGITGVMYYQIEVNGWTQTRKMVLSD